MLLRTPSSTGFATSWGTLATSLSVLGTASEICRLWGPFTLFLVCFLVGGGDAGAAGGPTTVVNSNGSGNGDSSVNAGDEPRAGSRLASPTATNYHETDMMCKEKEGVGGNEGKMGK